MRDETEVQAEAPLLCEYPLAGFMRTKVPETRYVLAKLIPRGNVTLFTGHGGTGKTCLAEVWCAHVASEATWWGLPTDGPVCVYVSLEDPGSIMHGRLQRIVEAHNLDRALIERNLTILDGSASDGCMVREEMGRLIPTRVMAEVEAAAQGADLVVIDNASDAYGANENDRRLVRAFVRHLAQIARDTDAAVLLLAHVDKAAARYGSNGSSFSGSTAWHNSSRSRLALIDKDGAIELHHEKINLGKRVDPIPMQFNSGGVLMPCDRTEAATSATDELRNAIDTDNVFKAVRAACAAGMTVPANTSGPATGWHVLQLLPELSGEYRNKGGKARVHAALVRLSREGRIARETYVGSNRNTRERYVLTQALT